MECRYFLVMGHLHRCALPASPWLALAKPIPHHHFAALSLRSELARSSQMPSLPVNADTCAICRNKLYEPSIEAQASTHHALAAAPDTLLVPSRSQACFGVCTACVHPHGSQRAGRRHRKRAAQDTVHSRISSYPSCLLLDSLSVLTTDPGLADDAGYSIAWGCCGHVFHLDCISRWLKTRSVCPL